MDRKLHSSVLSRVYSVIYDMLLTENSADNSIRLLKSFIKNSSRAINEELAFKFVIEQFEGLKAQVKEVSAQTVQDLVVKSTNLQKLMRSVESTQSHSSNDLLVKAVQLADLLELVKGIDTTQQRAEKVMSKSAFNQLKALKN